MAFSAGRSPFGRRSSKAIWVPGTGRQPVKVLQYSRIFVGGGWSSRELRQKTATGMFLPQKNRSHESEKKDANEPIASEERSPFPGMIQEFVAADIRRTHQHIGASPNELAKPGLPWASWRRSPCEFRNPLQINDLQHTFIGRLSAPKRSGASAREPNAGLDWERRQGCRRSQSGSWTGSV